MSVRADRFFRSLSLVFSRSRTCLLSALSFLAQAPTLPVLPATIWHWVAFGAFVAIMLTLDLTVFHKHSHEPTFRESALWTLFWCSLAFVFNGLIWYWARQEFPDDPSEANRIALEFLVGYVVEWSLSMDNVFVFAVIFTFFRVPLKYQYRVLFWGILGAVLMRLTFVVAGAALLQRFEVVMAVFGVLLVWTAYKLAFSHDEEVHPENNLLMKGARKIFPVAKESHGDHFFAIENGKRCVTPLFLVLLVVESTDVMFAVDSVPAILGLTKDTFIVFTSNVFAILGLCALLHARRRDGPVSLSQVRSCRHPRLRRLQDDRGLHRQLLLQSPRTSRPDLGVAARHRRAARYLYRFFDRRQVRQRTNRRRPTQARRRASRSNATDRSAAALATGFSVRRH